MKLLIITVRSSALDMNIIIQTKKKDNNILEKERIIINSLTINAITKEFCVFNITGT